MTNSRIQRLDTNLVALEVDILHGHLLGDGSVFKSSKDRKHCIYSHRCKQKEYLEWLVSNTGFLLGQKITDIAIYDHRTQKTYYASHVKSKSNEVFTQARLHWYPDGTKILPDNLIISARGLLRFYLDDGSWHKNGMYLATNDLSVDDVCTLQEKISKFCGFQLSIHESGKKDVYKLFVKGSNRKEFIDIIGQCPVHCYSYKWGE